MKRQKTKPPIKDRAFELDFIRGICIALMMLDHFAVACLFFRELWYYYIPEDGSLSKFLEFAVNASSSAWKETTQAYTIAVFFIVAGLAVAFSRKKYKSLIKTSLFAGALTAVTVAVSTITGEAQFLVTHGIFHVFAVCYLFYFLVAAALKDKFIRSAVFLSAGLFFILLYVYTESGTVVWDDSLISALFVRKDYFISYMDNQFIIPWLGFFLIGAAAAPVLYGNKKSLLPKVNAALNAPPAPKNILLKIVVKPINFIGRHPLFFYAFNIVSSVLLLIIVGLLSIGTEWITDILGML
jgi:uncharacterized membrane protein